MGDSTLNSIAAQIASVMEGDLGVVNMAMFLKAMQSEEECCYEWNAYGVRPKSGISDIEGLSFVGPKIRYKEAHDDHHGSTLYRVTGGFLDIEQHENGKIDVVVMTTDKDVMTAVRDGVSPLIHEREKIGDVHVVVRGKTGFSVMEADTLNYPLRRENYSEHVLQQYDHVVGCLSSKDPCGRIVVMQGPPGTGKSFMVKSLVTEVNAKFLLVPSSMIGSMSGPEMIKVLLDEKYGDKPLVMILEDADDALVRREEGNPSRMSELLNMGDGILGELADVRIVATTNAKLNMDDAMMRPGRLCRCMEIDKLDAKKSWDLYQSLVEVGKQNWNWDPRRLVSLAEVYSAARDDGWEPAKKKEFSSGQYL